MMKRILAAALALVLLLSCCSALADYDTHISFTLNGTHTNSNMDYNHDAMYDYIAGMFNFDYEVFPVSKDAQADKIRTWINGGTMPDTVTWRDFNYQEYVTFAEQGLIAALPEGWETKYPDLYDMMHSSMSEEAFQKFYVDGALCGIAHARNYRFNKVGTLVDHLSVYYRKDWAKELGFEFGDVITISQFKNYLRACIDKDMAKNGNTIGLTDEPGYMARFWMLFADVPYNKFHRTDNGYAWGFSDPSVLEALKVANQWYAEGLLDKDFYMYQSENSISNFTSGLAAAFYHNCAVSSYLGYATTFANNTGLNPDDCIAIATIATRRSRSGITTRTAASKCSLSLTRKATTPTPRTSIPATAYSAPRASTRTTSASSIRPTTASMWIPSSARTPCVTRATSPSWMSTTLSSPAKAKPISPWTSMMSSAS